MDPTYSVLLDAPDGPASRIQIARLGPVKDPRYGEFEITADNVTNWKRNLSALPGQRALIDFEHRSERKPRDSKAAGWITDISLDGDRVMADTEWSDEGADAIRNKRYLFLSPAYGPYSNEHGETFDDTLMSTALTNKPVLGSLPMLTLASEERVSEAIDDDPALRFHVRALDGEYGETTQALVTLDVSQAVRDHAKAAGHSLPDGSYPIENAKQLRAAAVLAASGHGDVAAAKKLIRRRAGDLGVDVTTLPGFAQEPKQMDAPSADSRPPMSTALLKTLGLPEDADEQKLLDTVAELQESAKQADKLQRKLEKNPVKTLEQQAADRGLVILDADAVQTMRRQAEAGETAMKQLHESRFETAFELALQHPEGPKVTPAEHDSLKHFYTLDADATLKLIEDRKPILPAKPSGNPTVELDADADPNQVAAAGLHPASHTLDQRIRKHMLDNKIPVADYARVMDQYVSGTVVL